MSKVRQNITRDLETAVELSQMSSWTGDNIMNIKKVKRSLIDERTKQKDKEELLEEVSELKQAQHLHLEEIKILKIEIIKLKKRCVLGGAGQMGTNYLGGKNAWMNHQDPGLMDPNDFENLKE